MRCSDTAACCLLESQKRIYSASVESVEESTVAVKDLKCIRIRGIEPRAAAVAVNL